MVRVLAVNWCVLKVFLGKSWEFRSLRRLQFALPSRYPCRKLDPEVLVVQSAQDWHGQNTADGLDGAGYRRILIQ